MIDIENQIIHRLNLELENVNVKSSYQSVTTEFPTVTVEEIDNSTHSGTVDSSGETHSNISIRIEIFTNGNLRKIESKRIRNEINNIMGREFGFNRNTPVVVPNYLDESIYRYVLNYTGIVDYNEKIYRG